MAGDLRALVQAIGGALDGGRVRNLSRREAEEGFTALLRGDGSEAQVAAIFVALRSRGMTGDELAGFAAAARARLRFPNLPDGAVVVATSRLGKSRHPHCALAGVAAAAAAGTPVLVQAAPHAEGAGITLGDVWRRLVGELHADAGRAERCLERLGLGCWQPTAADPGWRRLLAVENEIGLRCAPDPVCKLLAPPDCRLLVPARGGPVLGLASEAVASLGHRDAVIVQGLEGSLDPSVTELTRGLCLDGGVGTLLRLHPGDLALACAEEPAQLHESRLEASALATQRALVGATGPAAHTALLGAALILRLGGRAPDLPSAVGLAREAVESGAAQRLLERLASC